MHWYIPCDFLTIYHTTVDIPVNLTLMLIVQLIMLVHRKVLRELYEKK